MFSQGDQGHVDEHNYLAHEYLVTRYGADPTGVADSTSAINEANAAAEATYGGVVVFPQGDYRTTSAITKRASTWWRGDRQRYIASETDLRRSQGSRIVCDHTGNAVEITGDNIKQRGGMHGIQFYDINDEAISAIVFDSVQEYFLESVVVNGFETAISMTDSKAIRVYECYLSGARTDGIYATGCTDLALAHTQSEGVRYGIFVVSSSSIHGESNRWQLSGTANARFEDCGFVNLIGGSNDSSDDAVGLQIVDCLNSIFANTIYYSNSSTDEHVTIEVTPGETCAGVYVSGIFHDANKGVRLVNGGGSGFNGITLAGDFRSVATPWEVSGTAPTNFHVTGHNGTDTRPARSIVPMVDDSVDLGAPSAVWRRGYFADVRIESPDGTIWVVAVDDSGVLSTSPE